MKKALVLVLSFLFIIQYIPADDKGTAMGSFLQIVPGGRGPGVGDAVCSLDESAESVFFNPAGIASVNDLNLALGYSKWLDTLNYSSLAFSMPVKDLFTLGIGFIGLFYGSFPVITQDSAGNLAETGNSATASDIAFNITLARHITKTTTLGVTTKYISEKIENEKSDIIAFDIGLIDKLFVLDPVIGKASSPVNLGMAVINLSGKSQFISKSYSLPMTLKIGVNYTFLGMEKQHRGLFLLDVVKAVDDNAKLNMGLEYNYKETVLLRLGYKIGADLDNISMGIGFQHSLGDLHMGIDYSLVPFGDLGNTHRMGLTLSR
ncbi:MAG: PorV/PorQ family protein [Spirochaetes bacterium]|nr:PorV/PorQ family protein [Spirochaetota bacterium]